MHFLRFGLDGLVSFSPYHPRHMHTHTHTQTHTSYRERVSQLKILCLNFLSAGIIDMCYHTQLGMFFRWCFPPLRVLTSVHQHINLVGMVLSVISRQPVPFCDSSLEYNILQRQKSSIWLENITLYHQTKPGRRTLMMLRFSNHSCKLSEMM